MKSTSAAAVVALSTAASLFAVTNRGPRVTSKQNRRGGLVTGLPRMMVVDRNRRETHYTGDMNDLQRIAAANMKRAERAKKLAKQVAAGGITKINTKETA